jgi:cytochrome d ubiquinol oxidase subunit I
MEPLVAARLQMTLSLAFHMIFAAVGIGLPLLLVIVEGLWLRTGGEHYRSLARTWAKATGILFAVGAVSGTALSFELGLLWPRYMELTGAVVGHFFALEGYAFFIEAIFIGLYLYGWDRLIPWAHWWCGVVIAFSGILSGVLVLGVNAWMQLPVGFRLEAGPS